MVDVLLRLLFLTCALASGAWAAEPPPPPEGVVLTTWREPGALTLTVQTDPPWSVRVRRPGGGPYDPPGTPGCADEAAQVDLLAPLPDALPGLAAWLDAVCIALPQLLDEVPPERPSTPPDPTWAVALSHGALPAGFAARDVPGHTLGTLWFLRPMHAVVLAWWIALGLAIPRSRVAAATGALALAVRMLADTPPILMGVSYPYARFVHATGVAPPLAYGDTWSAFMGPFWWLLRGPADWVGAVNVGLSVLTVVALTAFVERQVDTRTARWAGLLLAAHPVAIALSGTETLFVLVGLLQVTALLGATDARPAGGALAASATVLLVWLRPLQLLFVPLPLVIGWRAGHRPLVATALALCAARAATLVGDPGGGGLFQAEQEQLLQMIDPAYLLGPGGSLIASDPWRVPAALALLGILAWRSPGTARPTVQHVTWALVLSTLPTLWLKRATDVLRFGLPTVTWWVVLAAVTLGALRGRRLAVALGLLVLTWGLAQRPLGDRFPWTDEHAHLLTVLPRIPEREVVRYDAALDEVGDFEIWANAWRHGQWVPTDRRPVEVGELRWLGRAEGTTRARQDGCTTAPLDVIEVAARGHDIEQDQARSTYTVGLARVTACPSR